MVAKMTEDELLVLIIKYVKEAKRLSLQELLNKLHPYEIAQLYRNLPEKHHHKFLLSIQPEQIAMLIQELNNEEQKEIVHALGVERSSAAMHLMESDELADLLHELSDEQMEQFLKKMKVEDSTKIKSLLNYPPHTAGGIMTDQFVWIRAEQTVAEAIQKLKEYATFSENIYYLYVVNDEKKLVGVISYRDLLIASADEKIETLMFTRVVSVPVDLKQQEVAQLIERYDFIAIPVVDETNTLVGVVTVDDAIDVMIQEATDDIEKLSATGKDIDFHTKALTASLRRLPWLILLLFIGLFSGSIISTFEETLDQVIALIFFMPMIAGMTGNTGTQSLAVVVRGIVTDDIDRKTIFQLIFRELRVGLMIGTICGLLILIVAYLWKGSLVLGFVVGVSLMITLIVGTLAGTIIPLVLYRFGVDPAVASGPLITTINDILSLFVYFSIATMFLSQLAGY